MQNPILKKTHSTKDLSLSKKNTRKRFNFNFRGFLSSRKTDHNTAAKTTQAIHLR